MVEKATMYPDRVGGAAVVRRADTSLRSVVPQGYWAFGDDGGGRTTLRASTAACVIVKLTDSPYCPPAFVAGPKTMPYIADGGCVSSHIEFPLSPLAAYQLLHVNVDQLAGTVVPLADLLGSDAARLVEVVREASSWTARFAALDDFLKRSITQGRDLAPEVRQAWTMLVSNGGSIPVQAVAREVGWSHKHLISKFRTQVGLPPKAVARLIRFERALNNAARHPRPNWGRVAADTGYADQSHLVRDFREFTGSPPTEFSLTQSW